MISNVRNKTRKNSILSDWTVVLLYALLINWHMIYIGDIIFCTEEEKRYFTVLYKNPKIVPVLVMILTINSSDRNDGL